MRNAELRAALAPSGVGGLLFRLAFAGALPLALALLVVLVASMRDHEREAADTALAFAERSAAALEEAVAETDRALLALASRPEIARAEPSSCEPLARVSELAPRLTSLVVLDAWGRLVCSTIPSVGGPALAFGELVWFRRVIRGDDLTIAGPWRGEISGRWVVTLGRPLRPPAGGEGLPAPSGVLAAGLDLEVYSRGPWGLPQGMVVQAVDPSGVALASSEEPARFIGTSLAEVPAVQAMLGGTPRGQVRALDAAGRERLFGYVTIPRTGWVVYAGLPSEVVRAPMVKLAVVSAVLGLVSLVVAVLSAFLSARRIERPIRRVKDAAAAIAAAEGGDAVADGEPGAGRAQPLAGTPQAVPVEGPREVAELARHFNDMLAARGRAERALHRETSFTESLLATLPGVLLLVDTAGRLLRWNGRVSVVTGRGADLLGQAHVLDLFPAAERPRVSEALRRVFDTGSGELEAEVEHLSGSRKPYYFVGVKTAVAGRPCCLSMGIDVSERHQLEEQLRVAQKMEAIGRLAGGVAHDFNNLLTVMTGYTELLLARKGPDDPERPGLEEVRKAAERAERLTRQLLAFSRRQVLQPKVLDLNAVVREVESLLRRLIGEDIALTTRLAPGLAPVLADRGQLEQVIVNLAVNARDAMPRGGALTLETGSVTLQGGVREGEPIRPGRYVTLTVRDTGHGMDADTAARAFEPFFTTKESGKGTGLGLSTVYGIVRQSGGLVTVASAPGEGAAFTVHLPESTLDRTSSSNVSPARGLPVGHERVLVVEDEDSVRALVRSMLQAAGYEVLEAGNAEQAEVHADAGRPIQLLLCDVVIPGTSGPELAARLTASHPEMKVLFMSGYTDDALGRHGAIPEGTNFIHKPFTRRALSEKVRAVLDDRAAR